MLEKILSQMNQLTRPALGRFGPVEIQARGESVLPTLPHPEVHARTQSLEGQLQALNRLSFEALARARAPQYEGSRIDGSCSIAPSPDRATFLPLRA